MTRDEIVSALLAVKPSIEREGATSLFMYGSRARGDARADSDLDLFVEYDPSRKFSLLDLVGIKQIIDGALGIEAHVTTRDSLHPRLKQKIEQQAIRVF
jgi:predicted nucleotidyltransferase